MVEGTNAANERAQQLAREAAASYGEIKRDAESKVVRWEWATSDLFSYEPAYFEINKYRRGRTITGEPDPLLEGVCGYGFDAGGRVVVERQQTEFPGRYYETFYRHDAQGIARFYYSYDPEKTWINAGWLELGPPGVVADHAVYARGNWLSHAYRYDATGRLVEREDRGTNPPYGDVHEYWDVEHDDGGAIRRIWRRKPEGKRTMSFERPAPEDTLRARRHELRWKIADMIVAALRAAPIDEPVYVLALQDSAAHYLDRLPPRVGVGRERERRDFLAEHGDDADDYIWNPAEWESCALDVPVDPELSRLCEAVNQDIWQNDLDDEADALLAEIARDLGRRELPLEKTADFVARVIEL